MATFEGLEDLCVQVDGAVATVEITRFERRNSLRLQTLDELVRVLSVIAGRPDIRATIVRGEGGTFCSGYDLDLESHLNLRGLSFSTTADQARVGALRTRLAEIRMHPKPIVAEIDGYCVAGGTDLLICCDVSVAADEARLGLPNVRSLGISILLPMWVDLIGPARAKLLTMTGDYVRGRVAADWGLVSAAVPSAQLRDTVTALAARIAAVPTDVMAPAKAALNLGMDVLGFEARSALAVNLDVIAHGGSAAHQFWVSVAEHGLPETLRARSEAFPGSFIEERLLDPTGAGVHGGAA